MFDVLSLSAIFLTCADAGGFAAAGRELRRSRSSVSKAMVKLEVHLGVRLFDRTTRSQTLTDQGALYYEHAQRAVATLDTARALLEARRPEPTGVLKVTAPVVFGRRCVVPILLELVTEHPALKLSMSFTDQPVDLVDSGDDLAIRIGKVRPEGGLMSRRLGVQTMAWCASPDYLARFGRPESDKDFAYHDLIRYGRDHEERVGRPTFGTERLRLDDLEALAQAARSGFGVAWLPCWLLAHDVEQGGLVKLDVVRPRERVDVSALWVQTPFMPSRLRVALEQLSLRLPQLLT